MQHGVVVLCNDLWCACSASCAPCSQRSMCVRADPGPRGPRSELPAGEAASADGVSGDDDRDSTVVAEAAAACPAVSVGASIC